MRIIRSCQEWQKYRKTLTTQSLGFIPTMGHLHRGHQSLIVKSTQENQQTIVSLFVNPTQFDQKSDHSQYPHTEDQDAEMCKEAGVDILFIPEYREIYRDDYRYRLSEQKLSQKLEGLYRPGHFTGVLTVVLKLFLLVQPHKAYFGEKDYQQLLLIKEMVDSLYLPIDIISCPTVRNAQGLALSSRNTRLSAKDLVKAAVFPQLLRKQQSTQDTYQQLQKAGFAVDYVEEFQGRRYGAVTLSGVRLIDNMAIPKVTSTHADPLRHGV